MPARVCIGVGTWQLVSLAAALMSGPADEGGRNAPCHLLLVEVDRAEELRRWMMRLATALGRWHTVSWMDDLLPAAPQSEPWPLPWEQYRERVRARWPSGVATFWTPHYWNFATRILLELYADAAIQVYEDGLMTYTAHELAPGAAAAWKEHPGALARLALRRRLGSHLASRRAADWRIARGCLRRVRAISLTLPPRFELQAPFRGIPEIRLPPAALAAALDACETALSDLWTDVRPAAANEVLVLGQGMYRRGEVSREQELAICDTVVRLMLDRGYRVCWKDHPRESNPLSADLRARFEPARFRVSDLPASLPVELLMRRVGFRHCATAFSSSAVYARECFGMSAYTYADLYPRGTMTGGNRLVTELVRRELPPLSTLPRFHAAAAVGSG